MSMELKRFRFPKIILEACNLSSGRNLGTVLCVLSFQKRVYEVPEVILGTIRGDPSFRKIVILKAWFRTLVRTPCDT